MIVGAYLDHAAPEHPAGAEWTIHDTFTWLAEKGHDCRIVSRLGYTQDHVDGVLVYSNPSDEDLARHFQECDVMVTQLGATAHAQLLAMTHQTPLVQYVHSANQLEQLGVVASCSALVVFNTKHVADACDWWPGASMIMRPPVNADRVRVEKPGACTTLLNASGPKGGTTLYTLAQTLDRYPFLAVQGAYGDQALTPSGLATAGENEASSGLPANLQVLGVLRDVRLALAYTRTLLVLSTTETYGRVGVEAAASGIPTISLDLPGLREALGDSAIFVNPDAPRNLEHLVARSYSEAWGEWSLAAQRHWYGTVSPRQLAELRKFERHLRRIQKEQPVMTL